ncbi:DUF4258 domain-containing protein [Ihubacter massiliensis]|uniref:DUF4258 domain-containing protein n=1 Tax=Anaerovoracaceae TaxID=543314 RepID=UPI0011DD29B3|nr:MULTISPECIES: DUF4258 domain-containing protein [Eubacteriales Family XIII. Incertae Sedis]MCI7302536.1 DUF4258 domain-containing protein [Clostridia bacterium]MCO7124128.1 DUF4258 domain-containing protein [Ihubacter massiliensis]MDY3011416.1 DUF4258 domain-containing protein [Clostridiales Family XIII bacterium]
MELSIEKLRKLCTADNIRITMHAAKRLEQRGILLKDVIACVQSGKIIEQYPDDHPFPSCLILGYSVGDKHLHAVIGSNDEFLFLITAYYPTTDKWENDFETRKEK